MLIPEVIVSRITPDPAFGSCVLALDASAVAKSERVYNLNHPEASPTG